MSNTKISFLYRDGSNYKSYNSVIVAGTFTDDEINQILDCLDSGDYFIPEQIGFPVERFGSITEDDHCWCELTAYDFEPTEDAPTVEMSADDVLKAFLAAKGNWDVLSFGIGGDNKPAFPDVCYSYNDADSKCVLIKWGEQGYYDPDFPKGFTKDHVNKLNSQMGISAVEAEAMKICSMANITSDKWPEHYTSILEKLNCTKKQEGTL